MVTETLRIRRMSVSNCGEQHQLLVIRGINGSDRGGCARHDLSATARTYLVAFIRDDPCRHSDRSLTQGQLVPPLSTPIRLNQPFSAPIRVEKGFCSPSCL